MAELAAAGGGNDGRALMSHKFGEFFDNARKLGFKEALRQRDALMLTAPVTRGPTVFSG